MIDELCHYTVTLGGRGSTFVTACITFSNLAGHGNTSGITRPQRLRQHTPGMLQKAPIQMERPMQEQRGMEDKMGANTAQRKTQRNFLDISSAAFEAGYSPRHFRRIIEEDGIPVLQIGRKFFILSRDLEAWKSTKGEARFQQTLQQLDGWIKQGAKSSVEPIDDFDDED